MANWGAENVGRPTTSDYKTAIADNPEWVQGLQWLSDGIWKDHFIGGSDVQAARDSAGVDPFGPGTPGIFYSHTWFMAEGLHDLSFAADIAPVPFNPQGNRIARIDADSTKLKGALEEQLAAVHAGEVDVQAHEVQARTARGALPLDP